MIQQQHPGEEEYRGERFKIMDVRFKGNNDLLTLTQPGNDQRNSQAIPFSRVDIIETNTFNANCISLADYGMQDFVPEMNLVLPAARRCKRGAHEITIERSFKPRYVAGALGPTNKTLPCRPM